MDWFTSNPHHGHEKIIGYCQRPWPTAAAMSAGLVAAWNARVAPTDRVWVLGDFALYLRRREVEALLLQLNGEKHLRRGNHDHRDVYRAEGWASVGLFSTLAVGGLEVALLHDPFHLPRFAPGFRGLVLHGHLHAGKGLREAPPTHPGCAYYDVGVDADAHRYAPVSLDEILIKNVRS